jgi:hypothetical protein
LRDDARLIEALLDGTVTLKSSEMAGIDSHKRSGLMRRVRVEAHPDWVDGRDARAAVLEITLESGIRISRSVELPGGKHQSQYLHNMRREMSKKLKTSENTAGALVFDRKPIIRQSLRLQCRYNIVKDPSPFRFTME